VPPGVLSRHTNAAANGGVSSIGVSSNSTFVDVDTPQQFFASVIGEPKRVSWFVDDVLGGNLAVGAISTSGLYTPSTPGTHTVKAVSVADATKSGSASLTVVPFGVYTFHDNLRRDGVNARESVLTPTNVKTATFGKLFSCPVDGVVYAQPLWAPALNIDGSAHNVVFSVTGANSAGGTKTTDAAGTATFCYTGTVAGVDAITAFADANKNGVMDVDDSAQAALARDIRNRLSDR